MYFLSGPQMQAWDRAAIETRGIPGLTLMTRAGAAVAQAAADLAAARRTRRVVLAAGRGNNGGDALVAAQALHAHGLRTEVLLTCPPEGLRGDARLAWERLSSAGVPARVLDTEAAWTVETDAVLPPDGVVVDGVLGTGSRGAPHDVAAAAVRWLIAAGRRCAVVAVDLPSGLDADSGAASDPCVRADVTVTFGAPKSGFAQPGAWDFLGHVEAVDIGLPADAMPSPQTPVRFIAAPELARLLPPRAAGAHKGNFGHVLVIGGSSGLPGAPALAAMGAIYGGAGLVSAAVPAESLAVFAAHAPASMPHAVATAGGAMTRAAFASCGRRPESCDVVVVGPGMSSAAGTAAIVADLLAGGAPRLVLDADALNVLAGRPEALRRAGGVREPTVVITPHPGEAARLLGVDVPAVQARRLEAARELADRSGAVVALKGAGTVVCAPGGEPHLNLTGNPGMATGGSGDVLSGVIAALWAQGLAPLDAARLGVYLHGTAGDLAAWHSGGRAVPADATARRIAAAWRWLAARE